MPNDDGWMSQSADTDAVLYQDEWLSIRRTPGGYVYTHEEKGNGNGVAVLAYNLAARQVVGRYEECPPHRDGVALCALTGQMDVPGEDPFTAATRELAEESGIVVHPGELLSLGTVQNGKQTDTKMHLFVVDVGDRVLPEHPVGDGTRGEANAYCEWIPVGVAIGSKDPLLITLVARVFGNEVLV